MCDGWCEQGGWGTSGVYNSPKTHNLLQSYTTTNYVLTSVCNELGHYVTNVCLAIASTASFKSSGGYNANAAQQAPFYWYACGYIDLSTFQSLNS